jgi:diguanylate cyclase (GGDEF)-like protein
VRGQDSVARWGGEELLVLIPKASLTAACAVAERLRESVAALEVPFESDRIKVSMTFGVSAYRPGEVVDTAISRADMDLYQGKQDGRNRVVTEPA